MKSSKNPWHNITGDKFTYIEFFDKLDILSGNRVFMAFVWNENS